jgi:hypothetical protein
VALDETRVEPPKRADGLRQGSLRTNLSFLKRLVRNPAARAGDTTTDLIARHPDLTSREDGAPTLEAALAVSLFHLIREADLSAAPESADAGISPWSLISRREGVRL